MLAAHVQGSASSHESPFLSGVVRLPCDSLEVPLRVRSWSWSTLPLNREQLRAAFEQLMQRPQALAHELRKSQSKPIACAQVFAAEQTESFLRFEKLARVSTEMPVPFSVAFSGGGVRAAAFHSGVLWRLAKEGILKDLEHLSLVSGGAYVGTSYISFLLAGMSETRAAHARGEDCPSDKDINRWHLHVIWKMIDRMQTNPGCLVRAMSSPSQHVGARHPLKGAIAFIGVLSLAFVILPFVTFVLFATSLAIFVDRFAGEAVRAAHCSSTTELKELVGQMSMAILAMVVLAGICQVMLFCFGRHNRLQFPARRSKALGSSLRFFFSVRSLMFCSALFVFLVIGNMLGALGVRILQRESCQRDVPQIDGSNRHQWGPTACFVLANVSVIALGMFGSCLRWPCLFIRLHHVVGILVCMWETCATVLCCHWRIFREPEVPGANNTWRVITFAVCCLVVLMMPFYGTLRQSVHIYYRRSLRKAFYHDGKDVLLTDARGVTLCPNIIVAATLVDYCRLDRSEDTTHYSEFFFTQQVMGGNRTGFIDVPVGLSLSRTMAISGAAADAFLLTKFNTLWVRFTLLGLFNVFMGDYVEFRSSWQQGVWCGRLQASCVNLFFAVFFVIQCASTQYKMVDGLFWPSWVALSLLFVASFFASFKCFRWLLSSPFIRHLHMAIMHYHTSDDPPLRLFLNDGGLVECLGLISLLRRRCRYMLVTDATEDFKMKLVSLRETMDMARDERICTFFDMEDPRRGVDPLMERFSAGHGSYLRLGVLYDCYMESDGGVGIGVPHSSAPPPGSSTGRERTGEIIFVRMRLLQTGVLTTIPCRISEDEVMQSIPHQLPTNLMESALAQESIGGCCCDSCHRFCNCGLLGRFPDISNGNQFLTSTQFSLLCRLGYQASAEAVEHIKLLQGRERHIPTRADVALSAASRSSPRGNAV
eukprot:TRINITY_DN14203_c0_g2_i1.p1 TRINITY_DN14203_c0_g2~~TRINITY_DN14203_c0_g2_i1.p1  ORF type:complete len:1019 (-),score=129.59 TRINITY_DN14203_c0_g2_i1:14-2815(-)